MQNDCSLLSVSLRIQDQSPFYRLFHSCRFLPRRSVFQNVNYISVSKKETLSPHLKRIIKINRTHLKHHPKHEAHLKRENKNPRKEMYDSIWKERIVWRRTFELLTKSKGRQGTRRRLACRRGGAAFLAPHLGVFGLQWAAGKWTEGGEWSLVNGDDDIYEDGLIDSVTSWVKMMVRC